MKKITICRNYKDPTTYIYADARSSSEAIYIRPRVHVDREPDPDDSFPWALFYGRNHYPTFKGTIAAISKALYDVGIDATFLEGDEARAYLVDLEQRRAAARDKRRQLRLL